MKDIVNKEDLKHVIQEVSATPDAELLASSMAEFNSDALEKFLKGHVEHGGSICDRPLLKELDNEIIDMMFYSKALKHKIKSIQQEIEGCIFANTGVVEKQGLVRVLEYILGRLKQL